MKFTFAAISCSVATVCVQGLLRNTARQEPDTSCGKGYDNLVGGSKEYFGTAMTALWTHPGREGQAGTFETELQCWYASMLTNKCGNLPSKYSSRNKELTEKCTSLEADWLQIWNMFDAAEVDYFKKDYPSEPISEDDPDGMSYKQAMETMKTLNKKELLCTTLFVVDDECGAHEYIRTAK